MIVWGGSSPVSFDDGTNTGGRYDPAADSWKPTSTRNVAGPRLKSHKPSGLAAQMIVWGGYEYLDYLNTGGRYNPATDSGRTKNTAECTERAIRSHTAVWTGALK